MFNVLVLLPELIYRWLSGSDGKVWVWVMGEHKDDLSLEELIEKRDLEEARKLAEKEMLESIR